MVLIKNIFKLKEQSKEIIVPIETLHALRGELIKESKSIWDIIMSTNKQSLKRRNRIELRKLYEQTIRNEASIIKLKSIIQVINFGKNYNFQHKTVYPLIFKLSELKNRQILLRKLILTVNNNVRGIALDRKFIEKELRLVGNEIDKTTYKINEFNQKIIIDLNDLGTDITKAASRLLAA